MLIPLCVLAVASAVGGFLGVPHEFHFMPNYLEEFLKPVVPSYAFEGTTFVGPYLAMTITTVLAVGTALLASFLYARPERIEAISKGFSPLRFVFSNKFWVDELYGVIIIKPFQVISRFFSSLFDPKIIDGGLMLSAKAMRGVGGLITLLQSGVVQFYLFFMLVGLVLVFWLLLKGMVI
jgi:NADH-quinone oxidoreductase subunit L